MPGGAAMPGWVMLLLPVMLIFTAGKAMVTAARKPGARPQGAATVLAGIGAISTALLLWAENIVISLGGDASAYYGGLLPWLLADILLLGTVWAGIAWLVIQLARRRGAE